MANPCTHSVLHDAKTTTRKTAAQASLDPKFPEKIGLFEPKAIPTWLPAGDRYLCNSATSRMQPFTWPTG
jgi:hypothetical protein